jgi:cellulose biosynthesis protein BcsQ
MIVLIANPKGGVGKSTVATNLAGYYSSAGYRTMLPAISIGNSRQFRGLRSDRNSRHALNHGTVAINIPRGLLPV